MVRRAISPLGRQPVSLRLFPLVVLKHEQQADVVGSLEGTRADEGHPQQAPVGEEAGDERAEALRGGLDDVDEAHNSGALARKDDCGEEGGSWLRDGVVEMLKGRVWLAARDGDDEE